MNYQDYARLKVGDLVILNQDVNTWGHNNSYSRGKICKVRSREMGKNERKEDFCIIGFSFKNGDSLFAGSWAVHWSEVDLIDAQPTLGVE